MERGEKTDYRTLVAIWIYTGMLFVGAHLLQHVAYGLWIFAGMALVGLLVLLLWYSKKVVHHRASREEEFQTSPIVDVMPSEQLNQDI